MGNDYSTIQIKEIKCPFCKEGMIKAHYRPSMKTFKTSRSAAGAKSIPSIIKEKWTILTECSNCNKTKGEIQKCLEEGESLSTSKAVKRAKDFKGIENAVMASDSFFPFRDGIDEAAKSGIKAIIQNGGSIRDEEVIKAANEHGIAMVFTGNRCFRH